MRILIERLEDCVEVLLLRNKNDDTYSYVNLTKGHICPCRFNSIADAIEDLKSYTNVIKYTVTTSVEQIIYNELKRLAYQFSQLVYDAHYSTNSYQNEKNSIHTKALKVFDILSMLNYTEPQYFVPYNTETPILIDEEYFYTY